MRSADWRWLNEDSSIRIWTGDLVESARLSTFRLADKPDTLAVDPYVSPYELVAKPCR
jgi:hypothetical protein